MTELTPANVAASVSRALWGEVSSKLRSVQFRAAQNRIELRFYFDGTPDNDELDSVSSVGGEVAADFADATVAEEVVPLAADTDIPSDEAWHTAYARREATLAR
jgi:hypothetical protein